MEHFRDLGHADVRTSIVGVRADTQFIDQGLAKARTLAQSLQEAC